MKNYLSKSIALFFTLCISGGLLAQNPAAKEKSLVKIDWLQPGKEYYSENFSVAFLRFKGAVYGEHFIPLYTDKIKVNSSTTSVQAEMSDETYSPLEETSLIENFKAKIKSSIEVTAKVSYERKIPYAVVSFSPIRKNPFTGTYEKLISFHISIHESSDGRMAKALPSYTNTSVLASGKWFKVGIAKSGVYKMDRSFLKSLGMNPSQIDPRNLRVYGSGGGQLPFANNVPRNDDLVENAIYVSGESDGHFDTDDFILFYAKEQLRWEYNPADSLFHHEDNYYADTTYYFITADLGTGIRIATVNSTSVPATNYVGTFNDHFLHEVDLYNCVKSGKEWYGESYDAMNNTRDFLFTIPNLVTSKPVCVRSALLSHSVSPAAPCSFNIYGNSVPVGNQYIESQPDLYYAPCAKEVTSDVCFNASGSPVTVRYVYNSTAASSQGWMDYIEVNAMRQLAIYNSQMEFRNAPCIGSGNVSEFTLAGASTQCVIWDVTDPVNVKKQGGTLNGSNFVFRIPTDSLHEFIAFNGGIFLTPVSFGAVDNQNLHGIASADLVIVTAPEFLTQAQRLGDHHQSHDTMSVAVVTTTQVYNEFSSGAQDVSAIRDFMKMLYDRNLSTTHLPKYLLLFGDASYDNKHRIYLNTDYVVSFQSDNSLDPTSSFMADDFFGFLDTTEGNWADGDVFALLDIGIGRVPVKSPQEATEAVDKIINYATNGINSGNTVGCNNGSTGFGEWRNIVTFIADDEDGNTHFNQAEALANRVDTVYPVYNIDKIYLDAYVQETTPGGNRYPTAEAAFVQRVQRGNLIDTYIGHGGEVGLAHERVLSIDDINSWTNYNRLACFLTATCEFTRVDDPARTSAGELIFLNSKGGGIALFTTTRLAFSGSNFTLCQNFFRLDRKSTRLNSSHRT